MFNPYHSGSPRSCVFYVSAFTHQLEKLLADDLILDGLKVVLRSSARRHQVTILGYVIMPDHLHLMIALESAERVRQFMDDLFVVSRHQLFPERTEVWRKNFRAELIFSEEEFFYRLQDIHAHPVRNAISESPAEFTHSSAAAWLFGARDGLTDTQVNFGD